MKHLFAITLLFSFIVLTAQNKKSSKIPKEIEEFVLINSGIVYLDTNELTVNRFYIRKTEVTNGEYKEFLADLNTQGNATEFELAYPDSSKWLNSEIFNPPLADYYFRHPNYNSFPVVNISYEAALLFCKWLEEKLNTDEKQKFMVHVRLPLKAEWVMAARAGRQHSEYAWSGPYLRNKEGKFQCNFKRLSNERIHYNYESKSFEIKESYEDVFTSIAETKSYWPNDYGLYNMCGNVAEMLWDKGEAIGGSWNSPGYDVRVTSIMNYEGPSPYIGFRPVISIVEDFK
ncbi:MAG: SUMF1/EgtB/PvdO family nonheme iron enzyme [Bacteroidetes bacterium]|jgi:formylglycine-generating enzyme required for sulfatase activity|nr:SUMF1/EgtB/PvdO family nonheme iron enzyme [Bacteroidota bacterium]MBT5529389.1 SUMF1/EgtB/PvdO family nonheme iron enzyme [Cytophagia bacterium]MBT3421164.1 SUMF1/EgtB/PvdO family nonheme iron enzyme [Bacteroidota bacterium]MBT4337581.1 SUMF1/EgtB/PvdO family nonheme iron enzyme [Bacteroidota bacterium]MBT4728542.1 SUMF1/EgtB/PvdO family nonheme iron enzyme [Bacteroidota bacterium]